MNQQGGNKGVENFLIGVICVVIAFAVLFYAAGVVAAKVFHGHSPSTGVAGALSVLQKTIADPSHPRNAWPAADQHLIPGAFGYYFVLLVMVALLVAIAMTGYRLFSSATGTRNGLGGRATQWARRGDMKALIVRGPEPGRLILGHVGGSMVATEQRHSVIVLGPTQSGKTTGLAVPSILEWNGPVIATSVKNDLAQDTLGWRERMGSVWVYDPMATTGLPASTWSPLEGAKDWSGAKRIAADLTGAAKTGAKMQQDGDFWYSAAGKLLAPYLFAAAANGYTMSDVVSWIDTQEEFEVRSLLAATGDKNAQEAADASWNREDRARSSIFTTAEVVIEAYSDPTVLESARSSEIATDRFFDGGHHTLYICAPSHEQDRLRPVFSTLMKQFIRAAYDFGKRLDPPLLIVLDEAANIAPLDNLDSIASTCSGLGIQLVTVWQDLSQINARYGDRANTVVNNHRAKIVLSGISDPSTLDYVSRLIGSEEVKSESSTIDGQGSKSRTISTQDKNLAPSDVVRRIKQNEGVLVYGSLLPARLRLRPWYRSKRLTAMVKNSVPGPKEVSVRYDGGDGDNDADVRGDGTGYGAGQKRPYDEYSRSGPIG